MGMVVSRQLTSARRVGDPQIILVTLSSMLLMAGQHRILPLPNACRYGYIR